MIPLEYPYTVMRPHTYVLQALPYSAQWYQYFEQQAWGEWRFTGGRALQKALARLDIK